MTWMNDSGAYIVGSKIGKTKLIPRISPNKTWEGSIGGVVVTYITAFVLIAVWCLLIASKLIKVFKDFTPGNIQQLIGWMVIGVIPLDALLVAASGEYLMSLIILALLPPCRMLNKYLYVT